MTKKSINIKLKELFLKFESYKKFPTIDDDIGYFSEKLQHFLGLTYTKLNEARRLVLIAICFNLGIQDFIKITAIISALDSSDHERAADEINNIMPADMSSYLAKIMKNGEFD